MFDEFSCSIQRHNWFFLRLSQPRKTRWGFHGCVWESGIPATDHLGGSSSSWGYPQFWLVYFRESPIRMDDWGVPLWLRKPPFEWESNATMINHWGLVPDTFRKKKRSCACQWFIFVRFFGLSSFPLKFTSISAYINQAIKLVSWIGSVG